MAKKYPKGVKPYTATEIILATGPRYDGVQEGVGLQFTDVKQPGSTLIANSLEEAKSKLAIMRGEFFIGDIKRETERLRRRAHNRPNPSYKRKEVVMHDDMPTRISKVVVRCTSCGWKGEQGDCQFGHDDFYCPSCGKEALRNG